jgi:filamentous hemagglutinin
MEVSEAQTSTGSWIAVLLPERANIERRISPMGHMVIVDAIDPRDFFSIRDPWQGTRYRMRISDFIDYWTEYGVVKKI